MKKEFYSTPEAAKICSVNRTTIWRWIKSGEIRGFHTPGGKYKIKREDLEYFIRERMKHLSAADLLGEKKILIVDNEPRVLKMLNKILSLDGYLVEEAGVKTMSFKPDLMILDLYMPGIDGFEVCERIKKDTMDSQRWAF